MRGFVDAVDLAALALALDVLSSAKFNAALTLAASEVYACSLAVQIAHLPLCSADALHIAIGTAIAIAIAMRQRVRILSAYKVRGLRRQVRCWWSVQVLIQDSFKIQICTGNQCGVEIRFRPH